MLSESESTRGKFVSYFITLAFQLSVMMQSPLLWRKICYSKFSVAQVLGTSNAYSDLLMCSDVQALHCKR